MLTTLETPAPRRFFLQPKQREFARSEADICIYGGAAGSGKSFTLLYDPIGKQHHKVPGFTGVIFRRTSPEITNPGGLWDEATGIYPFAGGEARIGSLDYRWPSGSRIAFRHLQHEDDKHRHQGAQYCYIGIDELPHFTESQFWYLISRNRSRCGIRPYVRATCNPDPGWVKDLLAPWVDDRFDGPRAASGELRWVVRVDGKLCWVDRHHPDAKSITFIRATLYDNQVLLAQNPEYERTLKSLPEVECRRLLHGDWNVRHEGLVYPGFEACIVDHLPDNLGAPDVGGIDFGYRNPFAALWGKVDHEGVLWIIGCRSKSQCTIPTHAEAIPKGVRYRCDPAQPESIAQLRAHGHDAIPCVHMPVRLASGETKSPLMGGIYLTAERIRTGGLRIYRPGCLPLVRALGLYRYDPSKRVEEPVKEDDHEPDAMRYCVVGLDRNRTPGHMIQAQQAREQLEAQQRGTWEDESKWMG